MTENTKIPAAQNSNNAIDSDPSNAEKGYAVPAVMTENAKNPKEGSDWLGGPQNGDETPTESDFTHRRFGETLSDGGNGDATPVGFAGTPGRPGH